MSRDRDGRARTSPTVLPAARGPVTRRLIESLRTADPSHLPPAPPAPDDVLADEDLQLALWICFELHYRGFADAAADWEWQPELIALRRHLETAMLQALRRDVRAPSVGDDIPGQVQRLVAEADGPSLARFVQRRASLRQFTETVVHRSVYHLKEADPHSWGIPRLAGRAKAALVEIQADEYGGGDPTQMHSELFRQTMRSLGLDDGYGRYVDAVPAVTLAVSNLMSLFGLRRDLRGCLAGHLAAFEIGSPGPSRRYSQGVRRLGGDDAMCRFYDVHVTADALHEQLAAHDVCGALVAEEPELAADVLFGAAACLHVDDRFATHVLDRFAAHRTSLRDDRVLRADVVADVS